MFNRCSVNFLLKSVVVLVSSALVVTFGLAAWHAYGNFQTARRDAVLTKASALVFEALHDLSIDQSFTGRWLNNDNPVPANDRQQIVEHRAAGIEEVHAILVTLESRDAADLQTEVDKLRRAATALEPLHSESLIALSQPKSDRRSNIAKDFDTAAGNVVDALNQLGRDLNDAAKMHDPLLDALITSQEIAWSTREAAGQGGAALVAIGIMAGRLSPEAAISYAKNMSQVNTAWALLKTVNGRATLPPRYTKAVAEADSAYFNSGLTELRDKTIQQLVAGEKPDLTVPVWMQRSLPAVNKLQAVSIAALDAASDRAAELSDDALRTLVMQLVFLVGALALAAGIFIVIGVRVIRPLHAIRDAMVKLAGGDLAVDVGDSTRRDEIGALFGTLATFRDNAVEKQRIEEEQKAERDRKEQRQKVVDGYIHEFDKSVGGMLEMVASASTQLESTAKSMSSTAEAAQRQSTAVAAASEQASTNVQTVASAAEELSSSIAEISRQVAESTRITSQAVQETEKTNAQIQGLAEAAQRIGDVVKLINDIAGQTNLLALNATIEAARAGEAGKGFAVVASEVKSLANQTAKATEEISAKIAEMQSVTSLSVEAVQGIGHTIARINEIATTIASAVEEQGAATQEIARNVQQASAGTAEVSTNIVGVTKAANDTGTASTQVLGAAGELSKQSESLRGQVDTFLSKIRAA